MPELPEVETVKNAILPLVEGRVISSVEIYNKGTIISPLSSFEESLKGKKLLSITREGKFLIFHFEKETAMLSHLRMEGKYFFFERDYKKAKHDMVAFHFKDGSTLAYNDVRKFGILGIFKEDELHTSSPLATLGKEPFDLTLDEMIKLFEKDSRPIKEALLDQTKIAGLGNIYVDETLFASKVNPKKYVKDVREKEFEKILASSINILNEAINKGGSTIKSFHPVKGVDGRMQNDLKVYGKANEPCPVCGTKLRKTEVGGRGTTYCPLCQRNENKPLVVGVTGPIHSGKSTVSSIFEKSGYEKIDCDKIVHALYENEKTKKIFKKYFGKNIVDETGKINKKEVTKQLSESAKTKKSFEAEFYPLVAEEVKAKIEGSKSKRIVVEVPLLVGSGIDKICDYIILVNSNENNRFERLQKEGKDAEKLMKINAAYRLKETKKTATFEVENNGDLQSFSQNIADLIAKIN